MEWLKNDEPLKMEAPHRYQLVGNGTALKIKGISYADTGAYMCQATNVGKSLRSLVSANINFKSALVARQLCNL